MGLMLAEPGFHTRCFVEWEEYPRRAIIAAQRAGYFAPAPIWDDLTTFDAKPLAGAIDTLLAGYPCQPFSLAGKRMGEDDPRHLWPHVARVARELGDGLNWIFLENVAGHLTLGGETVLRTLWDMGFTAAAGTFSAAETGAPHERQRFFIVAHRAGRGFGIVGDAAQPGCSGYADSGDVDLADTHGGHPGAERERSGGELGFQQAGGVSGVGAMDDPAHGGGGIHPRSRAEGGGTPDTGRAGGDVDDPISIGRQSRRQDDREHDGQQLDAKRGIMADASRPRPQGREQPGSPDQWDRTPAHGSTAERGGLPLFPPGPGDRDAWAVVMAASPDLAPSFARRDAIAAALNLAAILPADKAAAIEPKARGMARGAWVSTLVSETLELVDETQAVARLRNMADGLAQRTRALRLLGNGVVPLAAAHAWRSLAASHGLGPVDLEATDRNAGPGATRSVRGG